MQSESAVIHEVRVRLEGEDANLSWEIVHSMKPTLQV